MKIKFTLCLLAICLFCKSFAQFCGYSEHGQICNNGNFTYGLIVHGHTTRNYTLIPEGYSSVYTCSEFVVMDIFQDDNNSIAIGDTLKLYEYGGFYEGIYSYTDGDKPLDAIEDRIYFLDTKSNWYHGTENEKGYAGFSLLGSHITIYNKYGIYASGRDNFFYTREEVVSFMNEHLENDFDGVGNLPIENYEIVNAKQEEIDHAKRSLADPVIVSAEPMIVIGGTDVNFTIKGTGFGTKINDEYQVHFRNSYGYEKGIKKDSISASKESWIQFIDSSYYKVWSDTLIVMNIPTSLSNNMISKHEEFYGIRFNSYAPATGKIRIKIPQKEAISSNFEITVVANMRTIYIDTRKEHMRLQRSSNDSSTFGFTFKLEKRFANNTKAVEVLKRVIADMNCSTGSNLAIERDENGEIVTVDTKTNDDYLNDGYVIAFSDHILVSNTPALGLVKNTGGSYCSAGPKGYVTYKSNVIISSEVSYLTWDYSVNNNIASSSGGKHPSSFYDVLAHELGHFIGLDHVFDPEFLVKKEARMTMHPIGNVSGTKMKLLDKHDPFESFKVGGILATSDLTLFDWSTNDCNIKPLPFQFRQAYSGCEDYKTSINKDKEKLNSIFPNPSEGVFWIQNTNGSIEKISITSINGEILKTYEDVDHQNSIEINGIPTGIWIVKTYHRNGSIQQEKIVVIK